MKRSKFLIPLSLLIAIVAFATLKRSPMGEGDSMLETDIYYQVNSFEDQDAKNLAYTILSPRERYTYWHQKLEAVINSKAFNLAQKQKVAELKKHITPEVFDRKSDSRQILMLGILPEWVNSAKGVLSEVQILDLVFSLNSSDRPVKNSGAKLASYSFASTEIQCKCAVGSSFTCPSYHFSYEPVQWHSCTRVGSCVSTSHGCGAFGDNECDGDTCPPH